MLEPMVGGEQKPMFDWIEAHTEFSRTLYALLASHGVIAASATRSSNILVAYQFSVLGKRSPSTTRSAMPASSAAHYDASTRI
jgi:hypothetical protein